MEEARAGTITTNEASDRSLFVKVAAQFTRVVFHRNGQKECG